LIASGDYDRNGDVDGNDFLRWQREAGTTTAAFAGADGNGDGMVDAADLAIWQEAFGAGNATAPDGAVPEPSACCLAASCWAGFVQACRRRAANARN
jgi:hypothetical protein